MSSVDPGALRITLLKIFAEAIVGHAATNRDAELRHLRKLDTCCWARRRSPRDKSFPTLLASDVEGGAEFDVADVIAPELHVHETGNEFVLRRVLVKLDALNSDDAQLPTPMTATLTVLCRDEIAISSPILRFGT